MRSPSSLVRAAYHSHWRACSKHSSTVGDMTRSSSISAGGGACASPASGREPNLGKTSDGARINRGCRYGRRDGPATEAGPYWKRPRSGGDVGCCPYDQAAEVALIKSRRDREATPETKTLRIASRALRRIRRTDAQWKLYARPLKKRKSLSARGGGRRVSETDSNDLLQRWPGVEVGE